MTQFESIKGMKNGFPFYKNDIVKLQWNKIKNIICKKREIELVWLQINHTYSEEQITKMIREILFNNNN